MTGREITGVTDGAGREFRLVLTTQAQRAEEARKQHTASLFSPDTPALFQPQRSPTHCPVPNTAPTGHPSFGGVADARPGIPGEPARCATGAVHVYGSR